MRAKLHAVEPSAELPVGFRTSRLTKEQMGDLMETISEYGSRHGVQWSEPQQQRDAA